MLLSADPFVPPDLTSRLWLVGECVRAAEPRTRTTVADRGTGSRSLVLHAWKRSRRSSPLALSFRRTREDEKTKRRPSSHL